MRPLIWKEIHELRGWIVVSGGLAVALSIACRWKDFGGEFLNVYPVLWMLAGGLAVAVALGALRMVGERTAGSLDFLLVRPIAPGTIVWIKFWTGSVALWWVLFWMILLTYTGDAGQSTSWAALFRDAIGWRTFLWMLMPRCWAVYAMALVASVLCRRRFDAFSLLAMPVLAITAVLAICDGAAPFVDHGRWVPHIEPNMIGRVAENPGLFAVSNLMYGLAAMLLAWLAAHLVGRGPGRTLPGSWVAAGVTACLLLAWGSAYAGEHWLPERRPLGSVSFFEEHEIAGLAAGKGTAWIGLTEGFAVADVADPAHPRILEQTQLPLWETRGIAAWDGGAVLMGTRKAVPVDRMELVTVARTPVGAIAAGAPIAVGYPGPKDSYGDAVAHGRYLYLPVVSHRVCQIRVFDLDTGRQLDPVELETMPPFYPDPRHEERAGQVTLRLGGRYLYAASPGRTSAIDLNEPGHPRVAGSIPHHEMFSPFYGFERDLFVEGSTLFETSILPTRLVAYSLRDPAHPVKIGERSWDSGSAQIAVSAADGGRTALFRSFNYGLLKFASHGDRFSALERLAVGRRVALRSFAADSGMVYATGWDSDARRYRLMVYRAGD
jgi:hypothetical protein